MGLLEVDVLRQKITDVETGQEWRAGMSDWHDRAAKTLAECRRLSAGLSNPIWVEAGYRAGYIAAFEEAAKMMETALDVASNGQGCYEHAQYSAYKHAAEMLRARAAELAVETGE